MGFFLPSRQCHIFFFFVRLTETVNIHLYRDCRQLLHLPKLLHQHLFDKDSGLPALLLKRQRRAIHYESRKCLTPPPFFQQGSVSDQTGSDTPENTPIYTIKNRRVLQNTFHDSVRLQLEELQLLALNELIDVCLLSMSYWSRWGHKGELLRALKAQLEEESALTDRMIEVYLLQLSRVVLSYRKTWLGFFQAAYGKTKSAQAFIRAIQSEKVNKALPIADLLFSSSSRSVNLSTMDESDILDKLMKPRETYTLELAEDEIASVQVQVSQTSLDKPVA